MLIAEAKWLGQKIFSVESDNIFPMLNIGSSTEKFRKIDQPWIDEYITAPAKRNNLEIINADIKKEEGVDVVVDFYSMLTNETLTDLKFISILCSNVLEHLTNREQFCNSIVSATPTGGYIFVSCPFKYPYHPDPIDTKFRPDVEELARLFPGTKLIKGEIVTCRNYFYYLSLKPKKLFKNFARIFVPFYNPRGWLIVMGYMTYIFRNFKTTCVVLVKN
jgi:SAM-dependent methyltransferase